MIVRTGYRGFGVLSPAAIARMAPAIAEQQGVTVAQATKLLQQAKATPVSPTKVDVTVADKRAVITRSYSTGTAAETLEDHGIDPYLETGSSQSGQTADEGLSTGAKIGIGVGVVAVILGGAYAYSRR